jgi:hypothetical protein
MPEQDALRGRLLQLASKADEQRKLIVATKEGGAITGEERLRELLGSLYGSILSYEGRPATYLLDRADALERELADVESSFAALVKGELASVNDALKGKAMAPIVLPEHAPESDPGGRPSTSETEDGLAVADLD